VSSSRTTTLLFLNPKPSPVFRVLEPVYEDDEKGARIRAERAAAVAVDASWVLQESKKPSHALPRSSQHRTVSISVEFDEPAMFIADVSQPPTPNGPTPLRPKLPEKSQPSPHTLNRDRLKFPVVECNLQHEMKRRKPRRRGKSRTVERPLPTFWRPMSQWGGKSAGYAYGYISSRPAWTESMRGRPYHRDNMRKATVVV